MKRGHTMLSTVKELETNTQQYWRISQVWNAKSDEQIETGDAIEFCNDLRYGMNPHRPICIRAAILLDEIIQGAGTLVPASKVLHISK